MNKTKIYFYFFAGLTALSLLLFFGPLQADFMSVKAAVGIPSGGGDRVPNPFSRAATELNNKCEPEMKKIAANKLKDFRDSLEKNFQNKSSTSSLLPLALGKYREVRRELYNNYAEYYPNQGAVQSAVGLEPAGCLKIIGDTLSDARILMRKHAIKTSGVKKSTALIEKYKAVNDMLGTLHQQFALLKGYLDTFANKLPCYVKEQCLKS